LRKDLKAMFGFGFGLAATRILIASFQCEIRRACASDGLACTGKTAGPSLYHLLEVLGQERVLRRLDRAIAQP